MVDFMTPKQRSRAMSKVKSANTKPEKQVRSALHKMGFRFRINNPKLPGKPDIVLTKHRAIIFVHGCFWHHHRGCKKSKSPSTKVEFWKNKIHNTTLRDQRNISELLNTGWRVAIVWECGTKKEEDLKKIMLRLSQWLIDGHHKKVLEFSVK